MRYLDLCPSPRNPRLPCPDTLDPRTGEGCRCRGAYRPRLETTWRPAAPGEIDIFCPGCGHMGRMTPPAVTMWLRCPLCGEERRLRGTSRWRTLLWRVFGRHEGYNTITGRLG